MNKQIDNLYLTPQGLTPLNNTKVIKTLSKKSISNLTPPLARTPTTKSPSQSERKNLPSINTLRTPPKILNRKSSSPTSLSPENKKNSPFFLNGNFVRRTVSSLTRKNSRNKSFVPRSLSNISQEIENLNPISIKLLYCTDYLKSTVGKDQVPSTYSNDVEIVEVFFRLFLEVKSYSRFITY